jgi:DNA polymerase III delta subunit
MEQLSKIYYLWGDEPYLIEQEIRSITARIQAENGEEPEVLHLDGDEMSALELGEALQSSSLFSFSRLVVIKNPVWLGKNSRKAKKAEEVARVLERYTASIPDGQTLVICASENIASNPAAKFLTKHACAENIKSLTPKAWRLDQGNMSKKRACHRCAGSKYAGFQRTGYVLPGELDRKSRADRSRRKHQGRRSDR